MPVCPVVSVPAKNSAVISGSSCASERPDPVAGSRTLSSRSANDPLTGATLLMCSRRFSRTMFFQWVILAWPSRTLFFQRNLARWGSARRRSISWVHSSMVRT